MLAGDGMLLFKREEAAVAGYRALQRIRFAGPEHNLPVRFILGEALCRADFADIVGCALHRSRKPGRHAAALPDLLRRDIGPHGHLLCFGRIRLHFPVFHRIQRVLTGQRHDERLHAVIKGQACLVDGQNGILLQRYALLRHFTAGNLHGARSAKRVSLRHLRLGKRILAGLQIDRAERITDAAKHDSLAVRARQLKAHLRQLLLRKLAAGQPDEQTAPLVIAGQSELLLIAILHRKTDTLASPNAGLIRIQHRYILACTKRTDRLTILLRRQHHLRLFCAVRPVDLHSGIGKRLKRRHARFIHLLQPERKAHNAIALVLNTNRDGTARFRRDHHVGRGVVILRGVGRDNRDVARCKRRGDGFAVFIRRDLELPAIRIGHNVHGAGNRHTVIIHARQNQPGGAGREDDALLPGGQQESSRLRLNSQPGSSLFIHAKGIFACQRFNGHKPAIVPDFTQDFTVAVDQLQIQGIGECSFHRLAVFPDLRAQNRECLLLFKQQLRIHPRNLPGADVHNELILAICALIPASHFADLRAVRRIDRRVIHARRERLGDGDAFPVQRIRSIALARRIAVERHAAAGNRPAGLRSEQHSARRLRGGQLYNRGSAAFHDHSALPDGQDGVAVILKGNAVLAFQQGGIRRAGGIRFNGYISAARNLHAHAGQRFKDGLPVVVDHGELHAQLHAAGSRMLKAHAGS